MPYYKASDSEYHLMFGIALVEFFRISNQATTGNR